MLALGYGKGHINAKVELKQDLLENPIKSTKKGYKFEGSYQYRSFANNKEDNVDHRQQRRYDHFSRNEAILKISNTKVYAGDPVTLNVQLHCRDGASMYECGGRVATMNFYQDNNLIASLYIGFADAQCHITYPNGTTEDCSARMNCHCFYPEAKIYVFKLVFNATVDQHGVTFVAVSRNNITSNKVNLYVSIGGAVFTRWGNNSCGNPYNERLFPGFSNFLFHSNSPLRQLCLPERNTASGLSIFGRKRKRSLRSQNAIVSSSTDPCAVCRSRRAISVVMVPGRSSCYGDMNLEYNGYLIPGGHDVVCLDAMRAMKIAKTRFVDVIKTDCDGNGVCGSSLNVGPIECAVCSK